MGKTAIVLGGTGLTGGWVVQKLLDHPDYSKVKLISRSASGLEHEKLEEQLVEVVDLKNTDVDFSGDAIFCCIGTTKKKTPDREQYRKIDVGIPVQAAELAKENGVNVFAVVSAAGANVKSSIPYNKIKGEMEEGVKAHEIPHTYILQPGMIFGKREEKRSLERFFMGLFRLINPLFIGPLKKYKGVEAEAIAATMIRLADNQPPSQTITSNEIVNSELQQ